MKMKNLKAYKILGFVFVLFFLVLTPGQHLNAHPSETEAQIITLNSKYMIHKALPDFDKFSEARTMDLVYFKGKMNREQVRLSWMSSAELESVGFSVQMKIDNQPWEKIGYVDAYSESWHAPEYTFEIEDLMTGQYFFRLFQTDEYGNDSYSEIVSMNFTGQPNSLLAYPNPMNNYLYVEGPTEESISSVALFDLDGSLVLESSDPGNSIEIQQIPPGSYFLKCIYKGIIAQTKVIIQ
jgi:hypothetical protein